MKNYKTHIKLLCIAVMLFPFLSKGQSYYPMLGDSISWNVFHLYELMWTDSIYTNGDTIISGKTYKIINRITCRDTLTSALGYIREDTSNRQVWFISVDSSSERILYDFSLQEGDSIYLEFRFSSSSCYSSGWFYVDSIRITQILIGDRRIWHLSLSNCPSSPLKWIEGVGAIFSPLYLYELDESFCCTYTLCSWNNSIQQYFFPFWIDCYGECGGSGIEEIANFRVSINNFPNPFSQKTYIEYKLSQPSKITIEVLNLFGKRILTLIENKNHTIGTYKVSFDASVLPDGLYFYTLQMGNYRITKGMIKIK